MTSGLYDVIRVARSFHLTLPSFPWHPRHSSSALLSTRTARLRRAARWMMSDATHTTYAQDMMADGYEHYPSSTAPPVQNAGDFTPTGTGQDSEKGSPIDYGMNGEPPPHATRSDIQPYRAHFGDVGTPEFVEEMTWEVAAAWAVCTLCLILGVLWLQHGYGRDKRAAEEAERKHGELFEEERRVKAERRRAERVLEEEMREKARVAREAARASAAAEAVRRRCNTLNTLNTSG